MTEVLSSIALAASAIALWLISSLKNGLKIYVDEKAKNLATIEDVEKITKKVEAVKTQYDLFSHSEKYVFEKEYEMMLMVYRAAFDLQVSGRALRPVFDSLPDEEEAKNIVFKKRWAIFVEKWNEFNKSVFKNRPFFEENVYVAAMSIRTNIIQLKVDFEMTAHSPDTRPNWDLINKCNDELETGTERLCNSIRECIKRFKNNC